MNTECIKALRPGVALPPVARYFERKIKYPMCVVKALRPGVALPPAARYLEKNTSVSKHCVRV